MKVAAWLCALVVLVASLQPPVLANDYSGSALHGNLTHRQRRQILTPQTPPDPGVKLTYRYGLLTSGGQNSFCSLIFISNNAAVAAATCFEPGVATSQYGFVSGGYGTIPVFNRQFTTITKHPHFNPASFSNNIAVMTFDTMPLGSFTYAVAAAPSQWTTKRPLTVSMTNNQWNKNLYGTGTPADMTACSAGSGLYAANTGDFLCNTQVENSLFAPGCMMPYQYVDGISGNYFGYIGLYSHSSVANIDTLCTTDTIYNYYLNVANYIPWIKQVLNADVSAVALPNGPVLPTDPNYKMIEPTTPSSANRKILSLFHYGQYYYLANPVGDTTPLIVGGWGSPGAPVVPAKPSTSITTTTTTITRTTISTTSEAPTTASATATQTTTSIVPSTVAATATASETTTSSTTSTTTLVTTTTATSTVSDYVTLTSIAVSESVTTSTATATLTSTTTIQTECPAVTQCPPVAAPVKSTTTLTQTATATSTLVLTSYNFQVATVAGTGGPAPGTLFATVTFTATQSAATATQVVTVPPASSPTVTSTTTTRVVVTSTTLAGKTNSHAYTSTTTSTVVSVESPGAAPVTPPQPWAIALTIVIAILALLALCALVFMCCRRKKKTPQAPAYTDYEYPPSAYQSIFVAHDGDRKADDGYYMESSYNRPETNAMSRQYNSHGNYL